MKTAGLFKHLPRMLAALGPYYRHGQSYQHVCGWGKYTDQRQFLYERLVGICAGAAMCAPRGLLGKALTCVGHLRMRLGHLRAGHARAWVQAAPSAPSYGRACFRSAAHA